MSVNRYEFEDYGTNESDGRYVTYEDYAALESRCAALAAENAGLNNFIKADCWVWDDKSEEYIDAVDCIPETPATDAFLAEVRAQGVEMLNTQFKKCTGMLYADSVVSTAEHFAAQLRKGVQS